MSIFDNKLLQKSSCKFNESSALCMNGRPACPLPPPPVRKFSYCLNVDKFEGTVLLSLYNTVSQVFVLGRVNCLLLAGPSLGVVKHVLNNINVVESFQRVGDSSNALVLLTCFALTVSTVAQLRSNAPLWSELYVMCAFLFSSLVENHLVQTLLPIRY
jgi:hypothetical protein